MSEPKPIRTQPSVRIITQWIMSGWPEIIDLDGVRYVKQSSITALEAKLEAMAELYRAARSLVNAWHDPDVEREEERRREDDLEACVVAAQQEQEDPGPATGEQERPEPGIYENRYPE